MATRPVFGTFLKSWKTKILKSWKTKTLLFDVIRPCYKTLVFDGLSSKYLPCPLFGPRDISIVVFSFVMGARPEYGTFLKIVRLRFQKEKKNKEKIGILKRTKRTHCSFHPLVHNFMPETSKIDYTVLLTNNSCFHQQQC